MKLRNLFATLSLVALSADAEVWDLRFDPPAEYEDSTPFIAAQHVDSYYIGCGRDPAALTEVTQRITHETGHIDIDGVGIWSYDFPAGFWTCAARVTSTFGIESARSQVFTFAADDTDPVDPVPVRPRAPVLSGMEAP